MEFILSKKLSGLLCTIPLVYFAGITLYSLLPELFEIPKLIKVLFYWINNTLFLFTLTFTFSYFLIDRLTKLLIRGTSFFLLTLGIFQIIKTMGFSLDKAVWISVCPMYIIFLLITYLYVSNKLQK